MYVTHVTAGSKEVTPPRRRRRAAPGGKCYRCMQPAVVGRSCVHHWFSAKADNNLGSSKYHEMIKRLWDKQGGRCAYFGEQLTYDNASVDHKVPVSRGGDNSESNLQWLTYRINRMKTDMTEDEFLSLCRTVVAAADERGS